MNKDFLSTSEPLYSFVWLAMMLDTYQTGLYQSIAFTLRYSFLYDNMNRVDDLTVSGKMLSPCRVKILDGAVSFTLFSGLRKRYASISSPSAVGRRSENNLVLVGS